MQSAIDSWLENEREMPTSGTVTQTDRRAAQARNPEIIALLDSWDQPEHAIEQTETWNLLESALELGRSL